MAFWLWFGGLSLLAGQFSVFLLPSTFNLAQAQTVSLQPVSDSNIPVILPRSVWDNTPELQALTSWYPQNETYPSDWQPVERIVIHDTATPNNDPLTAIARIQSIYRFHAVSNGWGDIGYNYLIDRDGKIYEGRLGGNGSRGAHAFTNTTNQNFNYGSVGIALIGEYKSEAIPAVMVDSLSRLIGWLAATNNLDPTQTQKTFSIWTPTTNSFSSSFTGPVVVGHKDIDPGNPDPGTLDFPATRQLAAQYKAQYQGIVYQASNSPKVYQLANGTSTTFATINDFAAAGSSYQKLALISQSQLDLFSQSRFLKNPDGSLLQFAASPTIYLIDGGKKRSLALNAKQFSALGFNWSLVKPVTEGELGLYPNGSAVIYGPDKNLIHDSSGRVYYILSGRKHWVTSGTLFAMLGYQWKNVKAKADDYVSSILDGANMVYPSGTLVKASSQTVYLIDNGQRREFLSSQSLLKLGYKTNKIINVSDEELVIYPAGPFMSYKDGTLVKSASSPTVYAISGGQRKEIISNEQFANLGYQTKNILTVSDEELNHYASAGNMQYPDGTLVQAKGGVNVYQIKNGLANLIPDAATFKKLKLSWSKVLKISAR